MSLWKIAWRSITQRGVASLLTGLSMALGTALVTAVLLAFGLVDDYFGGGVNLGYNFVVGAKGGREQLVLNSVYFLSQPVGNLPYSYYQEFTEGRFRDYVDFAIPCCLGDSYQGFKVVGVTPEMFEKLVYGRKNSRYAFASGANFKADEYFTAVAGSKAAEEAGLNVGGEFQPTHGVSEDGHEHDPFRIVGVLERTGTPVDNAIFINIEGFYLLEGHALPPSRAAQPPAADDPHEDHDHAEHDHAADDHAEHDHAEDAATGALVDQTEHDADDHADHDHAENDHVEHDHAAEEANESADDDHDHPAGEIEAHADPGRDDHAQTEHADHEHAHSDHDHDDDAHGGHDHAHAHEPLPIELREVTAILVATPQDEPGYAIGLESTINKENDAQAVAPVRVISELRTTFVGPMQYLLLALAALVVVVAGVGILVSMYNSMNERRREIAVMRALGARRGVVTTIVLLEAVILALAGGLGGMVLGHVLVAGLSPWLSSQTGAVVSLLQVNPYELVLIPALIVLAALVGAAPAAAAYRTDVSKALAP